jgi:hypothetical protein
VRDAERLALLVLELCSPACDAGSRVALSRILPWQTQQAAIWRVAGVVTVILSRSALDFD